MKEESNMQKMYCDTETQTEDKNSAGSFFYFFLNRTVQSMKITGKSPKIVSSLEMDLPLHFTPYADQYSTCQDCQITLFDVIFGRKSTLLLPS